MPDENRGHPFREEQEDEPDRPGVVTFEEQDTRSLLRPEDEDPRSLLRPVPPTETRDEFFLRDTAGVPPKHGSDSRTCEGVFYNVDVNTNMDGLIVGCIGDFDAISGVHGSAAICGEELFYNADVNTNVVGFITDCTRDFGTTAADSAAMGGVCNLVSSSGNLQEKGTLPMDKETSNENVPSDAKGGCDLEGKHEQSMLSVSQGFYVRRPVLQSQCRLPLRHHRTSLLRVVRTCRVGQTTTDWKGMHRMRTGLRQAVTLV